MHTPKTKARPKPSLQKATLIATGGCVRNHIQAQAAGRKMADMTPSLEFQVMRVLLFLFQRLDNSRRCASCGTIHPKDEMHQQGGDYFCTQEEATDFHLNVTGW
jgi:hypothetical protein